MNKTGEVREVATPCCQCGRPSETVKDGEAFCMSCYLKKSHQWQPEHVKLAHLHSGGTE